MRLEKTLWCHMVSMEKIYSNIADHYYTCWNHFCTFVLKRLTWLWQFILHSFIWQQKLPCFTSRTHLQNYASSLPTLLTLLQFGTSPKLVRILKIKHLKRCNLKKESLLGYKNGGHKLGSSKCVFGLLPMNSSHK